MQKRLPDGGGRGGWLLQVVVVVVKYKLKRLRPEKNIGTLVAAQNSEAFFFCPKMCCVACFVVVSSSCPSVS